nr:MAG TPA: hypothetical protein [Caudoviricetes sp.]
MGLYKVKVKLYTFFSFVAKGTDYIFSFIRVFRFGFQMIRFLKHR